MRYVLFILTLLLFAGCKTQKSLTKTRTETTQVTKDSIKTTVNSTVKVLEFNDTLRSNSFVPVDVSPFGSAQGAVSDQTITAESRGIKVTAIITPRKDTSGKIIGNDVHLEAIAKPVKSVESNQKTEVNSKQSVVSSGSTTLTNRETKKSWLSLPWWVWVIAGGAAFIFLLIRFGKKYFKFFI